jgi:CheY-like chemotaxis protein
VDAHGQSVEVCSSTSIGRVRSSPLVPGRFCPGLLLYGQILGQGGGGFFHGFLNGDDSIEPGGAKEPHQRRPVARYGDIPAELTGPAYRADQRAEPCRVNERDARHVDDEPATGGHLRENLAELAHREGVEFPYGSTDDEPFGRLVLVDGEHASSWSRPGAASTGWYPPPNGRYPQPVPEIVVATDSLSVFDQINSVVGGPGTTVRWIRSGLAVREELNARPADLAIVDMQIGTMGGVAVALDLRLEADAGRLDRCPVLLVLDRRADVFLARRSGAEGWILKPLDPIRMRRAVSALLAAGKWHDASFAPDPVAVPVK